MKNPLRSTHDSTKKLVVILIFQEESTNPGKGIMITDNAAAPSQPPRIVGIKLQFPLNSFFFFFFYIYLRINSFQFKS